MNFSKKKVRTVILSSALLLTLGTVNAFAASEAIDGIRTFPQIRNRQIVREGNVGQPIIRGEHSGTGIRAKVEDGVILYSIDGGETWSHKIPEGFKPGEGKVNFNMGNGTEGRKIVVREGNVGQPIIRGEYSGKGIRAKVEDGVTLYSIDGGGTWSDEMPEGFKPGEVKVNLNVGNGIDGRKLVVREGNVGQRIIRGEHSGNGIRIKVEDGITLYSIDGGQSWSQKLPEGYTLDESRAALKIGTRSEVGIGNMVRRRNE